MPAKLIIQSQREALLKEVPLDQPRITIGRKQGNDLHFNRPEISGTHAAFLCENEEYFVSDLGSTNGTLLNGARLVAGERYQLQDKDIITITPYSITFVLDKDMSDTFREEPVDEAPGSRSGTVLDIGGKIRTGTEEHRVEPSPLEQTFAEGEPGQVTPAAVETPLAPKLAPEPEAVTPQAAKLPDAAPASASAAAAPAAAPSAGARIPPVAGGAISIYVWLGIGALFVVAAVGLIILLLLL